MSQDPNKAPPRKDLDWGLPFADFPSAARAVLAFLHKRLGFDLWMVTRASGDDYIVLYAEDHGYGVENGQVFNWTDSFCHRMASGKGPRVAPDVAAVPMFASAPVTEQVQVAAYVGVPLTQSDGTLFGTLCAIDPTPKPMGLELEQPLLELMAGMLSTILAAELRVADISRRAERAESEALRDDLTGLYNRRGWERLMAAEEARCQRYGHPACVLIVDLDQLKRVNDMNGHAAGDEYIRRSTRAIRQAVRQQDIVARVGGDEFAVLAVECDRPAGETLRHRIEESLEREDLPASIGLAVRDPSKGLGHAVDCADRAMYEKKRLRKT